MSVLTFYAFSSLCCDTEVQSTNTIDQFVGLRTLLAAILLIDFTSVDETFVIVHGERLSALDTLTFLVFGTAKLNWSAMVIGTKIEALGTLSTNLLDKINTKL